MGLSVDHDSRHSIGVFGGTFDPIHNGHLAVAEFALKAARLDCVLLVPTGRPWLRASQPHASPVDRLRMAELAVEGRAGLLVSRVDVDRPGETYTVDTLRDLRREYGDGVDLALILGADSARSLPRWKQAAELPRMSKLVIIGRPGEDWRPESLERGHPAALADYFEGPMAEVSATEIRRRLAAGEPVSGMMPDAVERYIRDQGLYGVG